MGASLVWRRSPLSLRPHASSSDQNVEQLAAYPLPRASLSDVARLRASGPLDLTSFKIQTASQKRRPREPLSITWELPRLVDDATTLRYVVELRPPPQHELVNEARRRTSGRTATPSDLAAAALSTKSGAVSARIEVIGPLSVVEALRTLPPLENLGVAALGPPQEARSIQRRSRPIERSDDASRTPSTSRSPSPQQARDEASQARARRLRDLAAWLLRRDGALSSLSQTSSSTTERQEEEKKHSTLVESVLDHLRDDELGDIQEDSSQRGRRSRRKKPTADALERLVAALPARDLAALADVERFHVATSGPEAGAARRVADALSRWGRPVQGVSGAYAR